MANGTDTSTPDFTELLRKRNLLSGLDLSNPDQVTPEMSPSAGPVDFSQIAGSQTYRPPVDFSQVAGSTTYQPPAQPVAPPPNAPTGPPLNLPFPSPQPPDTSGLTADASNLANLIGKQPLPQDFHQNRILKAVMTPVAIMAGMGGMSSSEIRESMNDITRKGFSKAESDYKRQLETAQAKYGIDKDTTKTMMDVFKEKLDANKQAAEVWKDQLEAQSKQQEIAVRAKELEIRKAEIPPLNQALAAKARSNPDGLPTYNDVIKSTEDYYTAQEKSRLAAEQTRLDAARVQKELEDKTKRQETNIGQNITKEQARLDNVIKPITNARGAVTNLKTLLAAGDTDGFSRLMTVIMADNALSSAAHGSVRQNIGIIDELIKSPGWLEYLKGKAQGILVPGKGSISDATISQINKIVDTMDRQLASEEAAQTKNLSDLNSIDPTDPDARSKVDAIIKRQYDIPKPEGTPQKAADDKAKLDDLQKKVDAVDAAIKKKLGQK